MKLILLRGLPGSGKTTFATFLSTLGAKIHSADDCWDYDYVTDPKGFTVEGLKAAHEKCRFNVTQDMCKHESLIVVHNTNTTERELAPYIGLAKYYGYELVSLIMENRHEGVSVHNVPEEKLEQMRKRFEVKL
jgi:predicted kinase